MPKLKALLILVFIAVFAGSRPVKAQHIDTIYFNAAWQICEKPFASYYRFGKIVIDSFWYYSGRVQDYYLNDTMAMAGNYSTLGFKDGPFWFFYKDGTPKAKGNYAEGRRSGIWEYYYRNGKLYCRIEYDPGEADFSVLDLIDSTGKELVKDSTGSFQIPVTNEFGNYLYRLEGECKNGKPVGNWKYFQYNVYRKEEMMVMKEIYEKGEFKKGTSFSVTGYTETYKQRRVLRAIPEYPQLRITESFSKDKTSFRNVNDDMDLLEYLANRKSPDFEVDGESFADSYTGVLKALNTNSTIRHFNEPNKFYNGEVIFNLSDSGDIEEIEIKGNLSEKEKEHMTFFMKKFKNIKELLVENVVLDAYHKLYFYTVIFAEFIPNRYLFAFPKTMFVFAAVPYEKLKQLVKENRGKKKKKK